MAEKNNYIHFYFGVFCVCVRFFGFLGLVRVLRSVSTFYTLAKNRWLFRVVCAEKPHNEQWLLRMSQRARASEMRVRANKRIEHVDRYISRYNMDKRMFEKSEKKHNITRTSHTHRIRDLLFYFAVSPSDGLCVCARAFE